MSYSPPIPVKEAVLAVLGRYFDALEEGRADAILPDPSYRWRFYLGEMTVERMRAGLEKLDAYVNHPSQHNWAQTNHGAPRGVTFERGPDLSRLPDLAVVAMFQELDGVFADAEAKTHPSDEGYD